MVRTASGALLLVIMFAADTASARPDCGGYAHFVNGVTMIRRATMHPGERCNFTLASSRGPMAGIRVSQKPTHGQATVTGLHRVTYVAARGYVGEDAFTYERYGLDNRNNPLTAPMQVLVKIVR